MQTTDTGQAPFKRILVVLSPEMLRSSHAQETALLRRASALATHGAELELFYVCQDAGPDQGLFTDEAMVGAERQRRANEDATRLAELAVRMEAKGARVNQDVRRDHPPTDAILRKIADYRPDLVMKRMQEHTFLIGLTSNVDWDLVRRSPVHLWFVKDGVSQPATIVTAVGAAAADEDIISATDYSVFGMANLIAQQFAAVNIPVHAYPDPQMDAYGTYALDLGMGMGMGGAGALANPLAPAEETWRALAREHGRQIREFAGFFHIDPQRVRLEAGRADEVVPRIARSVGANLVVMGARNLGRWERITRPVSAEPVLADAPCDVVIIKDGAGQPVPAADESPTRGKPVIDVEQALIDPEQIFGSPAEVTDADSLSTDMRRRILAAWEQDVHARMTEDNEGGPVFSEAPTADLIGQINEARARLASATDRHSAPDGGTPSAGGQFSKQKRRLIEMTEKAKSTRDEYIQKMKAQLDMLNGKMAKLETRGAEAKGDMKRELDKELDAIRRTRKEAEEKLKTLRQSSDEAWDDLKVGAERAWRALSESVDSASRRFQ